MGELGRWAAGAVWMTAVWSTVGCGPSWQELARRGNYLEASRILHEENNYAQFHPGFGGLLRSRTRGTLHVHAYTRAELTKKLGWLPPALRDGRAVVLRTRLQVEALPSPRLVVETTPYSKEMGYGPTFYPRCCNLWVWAKLNDRPEPKLPPEPKALSTWGAIKATLRHAGRGFGKLLSLSGGVLADVTWLSTLGALDIPLGYRPSALLRKVRLGGAKAKELSPAERAKLEAEERRLAQAKRELKALVELRRMMLDEKDAVLVLKRPKERKERRKLAEMLVDRYRREGYEGLQVDGPDKDSTTMLYFSDKTRGPKSLHVSFCWDFAPKTLKDYRKRCLSLRAALPPGASFAERVNKLFAKPLAFRDPALTTKRR